MSTNGLGSDRHGRIQRAQQRRLRGLLLLPLLLLLLAGFAVLVAVPHAWGAASVIEIPDWMPSFMGAVVAVGSIAIAGFGLRALLRVTRGEFEVHSLQAMGGALLLLVISAMVLGLAVRLPDPDAYESTINEDGEITVGPTMFLASGIVLSMVSGFVAWLGSYLYTHALTDMEPNRISRRLPNEVDGVGELLRERR